MCCALHFIALRKARWSWTSVQSHCEMQTPQNMHYLSAGIVFARDKSFSYLFAALLMRAFACKILQAVCLLCGHLPYLQPCHAAGSCVCNEANLSGEAMPVQKRQCPAEDVRYEVEGRGARHTLFSSTAVLQAGNTDLDEVLAVVTATGMTLAALQMPIYRL